jgi:hypothetical protein
MPRYTFAVDTGGRDYEVNVVADNPKAAHKAAWASLSDDQKDAACSLECVDESPIGE